MIRYQINDGRIVATAKRHQRARPLRADYALEYRPGLVAGIVEVKRTRTDVSAGVEQAKRYARLLDVPFAYATNGTVIYRIDMTGSSSMGAVTAFPGPDELWEHYRVAKGISPGLQAHLTLSGFDQSLPNADNTPKRPRYYQRIAVNRTVRAIANEDKRLLLVLATGTGKTLVAHQVVSKVWESGWTPGRKPRVLYLADRNMLIDQPKDEYFAPSSATRCTSWATVVPSEDATSILPCTNRWRREANKATNRPCSNNTSVITST